MADRPHFDLELFLALNEEYRARPIVPQPRSFDDRSLADGAARRLDQIEKRLDLDGKRILEIGCGRGHICRRLADDYGCEAVGVDIKEYPHWQELSGNGVDLRIHDVSQDDNGVLGTFDVILSFAVWEHVEHPYAALEGVRRLLAPEGRAYIYANLYRGPKASHRYREVFFPWPHLLFTDEVFEQFYETTTGKPRRAAWVNKLTAAQYLFYFDQLGLVPEQLWYSPDSFDEGFYARFPDPLNRYPRFDLSHDFISAVLRHVDGGSAPPGVQVAPVSFARRLNRRTRRLWSSARRRMSRTG